MSSEASVGAAQIRAFDREALDAYLASNAKLGESEALAVLANRHCTPEMCAAIAMQPHLTAHGSVRVKLVAHRQTPQTHALKFVHYLTWNDQVRLSTDVRVPPVVRKAIDTSLLARISKMTLGQKVAVARTCGREVAAALLRDPDAKVFAALLNNARLAEDDLVARIASGGVTDDQLRLIANDRKWSYRHPVRMALVLNPGTPRAVAATQLRHLKRSDLRELYYNPNLSTFLKRCIEALVFKQPSETETLPS